MTQNLSSNNTLVNNFLRELRDINLQNDKPKFRKNIHRIGEILAYEISKNLNYQEVDIQTPLTDTKTNILQTYPVLATVLRAGLPLHEGLLSYFDQSECAYISAYRKHNGDGSFEIQLSYIASPDVTDKDLVIADPMLATGGSLVASIQEIYKIGKPKSLHIACVIAVQEGIDLILSYFPEAHIYCGAIDPVLTDKKYIYPGLGDAGDLCYGPKLQN